MICIACRRACDALVRNGKSGNDGRDNESARRMRRSGTGNEAYERMKTGGTAREHRTDDRYAFQFCAARGN